jgi:polysaccharide export outer membrane protein
VGVITVLSQKVVVLGEVKTPGLFNLDTPLTAIEAVSKAGGFTIYAKKKNVLLIRGGLKKPDLTILDMDRYFNKQDMAQNVALKNGDIIYVPATYIENVARFFDHLSRIISPIVSGESGYYIGSQIVGGTSGVSVPTR